MQRGISEVESLIWQNELVFNRGTRLWQRTVDFSRASVLLHPRMTCCSFCHTKTVGETVESGNQFIDLFREQMTTNVIFISIEGNASVAVDRSDEETLGCDALRELFSTLIHGLINADKEIERIICIFKCERIFSLLEEEMKLSVAFFASSLCVFSLYRLNTIHPCRRRRRRRPLLSSSARWWRMNTKQANNILRRLAQIYTCRYLSCS